MSQFIFRTDGGANIGLGHVMRCLSIADACHRLGHEAHFVLAGHEVEKVVTERGYSVTVLGTDYQDMEGELDRWKALECAHLLEEDGKNVFFVVDSYYVTERYLRSLKESQRVVYIDDLAAFAYPVDMLVNYNAYADESDYMVLYGNNIPDIITGIRYAPLREMFQNIEPHVQKRLVKDILVSTGGADTEHLAIAVLKEIKKRGGDGITYHMLVGKASSDVESVRKIAGEIPNVVVHENVSDMRGLICSCDVAVSAAGSTVYELCACGVPLVTYVLADNQIRGAETLMEMRLAVNCGDVRELMKDGAFAAAGMLLDAAIELGEDFEKRVDIGKRMQEMVDGKGAERLVNKILEIK